MTSPRKASATRSPKGPSAGESSVASSPTPRHRVIYEELLAEIQAGIYKPGDRLPSEALLCERFDASRITVAKAVQSLQRDHFVTRRPGSGTYVQLPSRPDSLQFGLLIPDLGAISATQKRRYGMRQISLREFRTRGSKALSAVPSGETILLSGQHGPAYFLVPVVGDVAMEDRELRRAMCVAIRGSAAGGSLRCTANEVRRARATVPATIRR